MTFPFITCITAGLLLLLQIILAMTVRVLTLPDLFSAEPWSGLAGK